MNSENEHCFCFINMSRKKKAKGPLSQTILDEIALDGLEGVTLDGLWIRLSETLLMPSPLPITFKERVWEFLQTNENIIEMYKLPQPRPKLEIYDRFKLQISSSGYPVQPPDSILLSRFKFVPIQTNKVIGSCECFNERKLIDFNEIKSLQLQEVYENYGGEGLTIVGSQELRESILYPENVQRPEEITTLQYCILELIARSRYNGENTAGKFSITQYCKDSADVFYIRNKLCSYNLIIKQFYSECVGSRAINGYLLNIPRFFIPLKTKPFIMFEMFFNILSIQPDKQMEYDKFKLELNQELLPYLKKLHSSPIFMKFFETRKVAYRDIYPDATKIQWKHKTTNDEKQITVIRMKNDNVTLENIFNEENLTYSSGNNNNSDGEGGETIETDKLEFLNNNHHFIDMPYMQQVYRIIDKHGPIGCSQLQILRYFGTTRIVIRGMMKSMLKLGIITQYWQDFGRQRTRLYVAVHHPINLSNKNLTTTSGLENNDKETIEKSQETNENISLVDTEQEDLPQISEDILTNIKATIIDTSDIDSPFKVKLSKGHDMNRTLRQAKRKTIIVTTVNKKKLVTRNTLKSAIVNVERNDGYKDELCMKSMYRIIDYLAKNKIIKLYNIILEMKKSERVFRYIADPEIEPNHELFKNEIIKLKSQFHFQTEQSELRKLCVAIKDPQNKNKIENISNTSFHRRAAPKFLTSRFFHEFLYYLIYELKSDAKPITNNENTIKMLVESYPQYNLNNLNDDLTVHFEDNISWKMFIPPLMRYNNKPFGWAYLMDVLARIPLSLLMNLYQIDKESNPILVEYLNHPIKKHYLVQKLPNEMQEFIFKLRIKRTCSIFLRLLNLIGLIQFGKRSDKNPKETWFFLNHKAKLLDTSLSEPAYRFISSDREYKEYLYNFETFQEVQNYWEFLYKICHVTPLGVRIDVQLKKKQEPVELIPVDFDLAPSLDIGYIPGDKRGAACLDSLLFAHLKTNWSWSVNLTKKKLNTTNALQRIKLSELNSKKITIKLGITKRKIALMANKKNQIKKRNKSTTSSTAKSKRHRSEKDEIDREALKRMNSIRTQWNKDEDRLLKICRVVYIYLNSSVSQLFRVIDAHNYRDILHSSLNSRNKTSKACQRRIRFLLKNKTNNEISAWLHELKRNPHITKQFGPNILDNLRKIYPDDIKFSEVLKIYFVQLVYYLNKITKNTNLSIENECIIPDTLQQFYHYYKECPNSPALKQDNIKHFDPECIEDIEISTINSLMHSTMCSIRDKALYNIQIFEIYKNFKEETLSKAFKKAKCDGLVVSTKGYRKAIGFVTGPSFSLSIKYRQALLYLNIPYELIGKCYESFEMIIPKFFSINEQKLNDFDKVHVDFKTINSETFYLIAEMAAKNQINIDIQMPQKMLTIDPNQKQNINDSERILDHFRQIFDNAPKTKYLQMFEEENQTLTNPEELLKPHVKFNTTNDNYILNYNPFNVLLKISDDYVHFFCALDHLNKIIDLDFSSISDNESFCPFSSCILKNSNFIGSIERIIHDKKSIIEDIIRCMETEEILENIMILNQKNIMQVYYRLQDALRKRSIKDNAKDFGKLKKAFQPNNLNILNICKDIMDYTENNGKNEKLEYEPTLNKEEKIIRAHDVFVVNLPTLKISLNESEFKSEKFVKYQNRFVPETLITSDLKREEILKKVLGYSIWSNFGHIDKLMEDETYKSYSIEFQNFTLNVLSFINTLPMGATAQQLVEQFNDESHLTEATKILRIHYLIMRVGIENFMYVHKNNVSNWIIQTYHIKRLDKEALHGSNVIVQNEIETNTNKRKFEEIDDNQLDESEPVEEKFYKSESGKRISKPVERFSEQNVPPKTKTFVPNTIIIRPCPWIRINSSLNRRVLDRWLGSILLDCLSNCGQLVQKLCTTFNQLHPVNILCLLEILKDLDCIELKLIKSQKSLSLFTNYEEILEGIATEFSKLDEVFIIAKQNALINIAVFIGEKKYRTDFI